MNNEEQNKYFISHNIELFTAIEFCSGLFSYMAKINIRKFNIDELKKFIKMKLNEENFKLIFIDINPETVIEEGISDFEIIGCIGRLLNKSEAEIHFRSDTQMELIKEIPILYSDYIREFAEEFKETMKNSTNKKVLKMDNNII